MDSVEAPDNLPSIYVESFGVGALTQTAHMWKDFVPWLAGPLGIVLGWWLNQQTLRGTAERQAKQIEAAAERQRVLDTVRLGRDQTSHIRSILHAIFLKSRHGAFPEGFQEKLDELNMTRGQYRNAVLGLRVQGPSWAVAGAEELDVAVARLEELALHMQSGVTAQHMEHVNSGLPDLARLLSEYVDVVSRRYNSDASALPAQPDLDVVGRWQPDGETGQSSI